MDGFYERLEFQAATVDELLSDAFETLPSQKADVDLAARRLAAWCRSCASGDWSLFERRLSRDALTFGHVLSRFAAARRKASVPSPLWIEDAIWIEKALQGLATTELSDPHKREPCAFEQLLTPVIEQAAKLLGIHNETKWLTKSARDSLTSSLLKQLSECCAPALYELFSKTRKTTAGQLEAAAPGRRLQTTRYDQFIADMKEGGFRRLFENKPVLLRIIATVTRQWIDTSRELIFQLNTDLADIHRKLLPPDAAPAAVVVDFDSSDADRHNGGRSVQIVTFSDGSRVAYKPKDLRLDVAWRDLISRLNEAGPPIQLTTPRTIACNGYGWAEFINHAGCASTQNHKTFFQRAGAWLALFHCFAATDMHQENIIAAGDHPIPIDLETLFHVMLNENQGAESTLAFLQALLEQRLAENIIPAGGYSFDESPTLTALSAPQPQPHFDRR